MESHYLCLCFPYLQIYSFSRTFHLYLHQQSGESVSWHLLSPSTFLYLHLNLSFVFTSVTYCSSTNLYENLFLFLSFLNLSYLVHPPLHVLPFRTHCTLYVFITDYIKDAFLAQLHMETAGRLEQATKALDQWKTVKDSATLHSLKVSRPLLQVSFKYVLI